MTRVVLPTSAGNGLDDLIFEHFGHAPYLTFIDLEVGEVKRVEVVKNPHEMTHSPGELPAYLKDRGASVLICMGMGYRAKVFFKEYGIEVYTGASGRVRDVVNDFTNGVLKSRDYEVREKWGG